MNRIKRVPERLKHTFRIGSPGFNWLFVGLAVLVTVVGVLFGLCSWSWIRDGAESPESNGATLRNIGLLIGGVLALVFALWRSLVAGHQADAAKRQAEVAHQQANLAQQGLLNERYQQGAEMLGNDVLSVRLGGIYALRNLADEHPEQYHVRVMSLLCAFVRYPFTEGPLPSEDFRTAMDVIGSRNLIVIRLEENVDFVPDLSGVSFQNANLSGTDLSRANLSDAYLLGVNLSDVRGLTQAQLDEAIADPDNLPKLDGVLDAESGEPLEWRGGIPRD